MKKCLVSTGVNSSVRRRIAAKNTRKKGIIAKNAQRYNLGFTLLLILFISSQNKIAAQSDEQRSPQIELRDQGIEIKTGLNRLDYLAGIAYTKKIGTLVQINPALEVGLSRTFSQGRFNPRLSFGVDFFLLSKNRVRFGPSTAIAYSFLQVNKNTRTYHHWFESLIGYSLELGERVQFTHRGMFSGNAEVFKSQITNKPKAFVNFGFYAEMGVKYCW